MSRPTLALASLAVATAACLAVLYLLREPSARAPGLAPVASAPSRAAPLAALPPRAVRTPEAAPAQPGRPDDAELLAARARAADAQEQALRDALVRIGEDEQLPLEARLERYREALDAARASAPDAPVFGYPSMLTEIFLRTAGVQRQLAAMSPAERAAALAQIRGDLGFDEEGIARMAAIDERREARWQVGLAYMQERARVAATFEGDARDAELRALREEYFADEAPTIEAEERDGFFRFERPRVYGRN